MAEQPELSRANHVPKCLKITSFITTIMESMVQNWMASGEDEKIDEIVSEFTSERTSLLDIVKALAEYLVTEDDQMLGKGVELLSLVVARVPPSKLNSQSVSVLTAFFSGKLGESSAVKHALNGILALLTLPGFVATNADAVFQALWRDIRMKGLVQDVRFKVFSIIDILMAKHREVLKLRGKEFLDGYISLAEGEKDPRNLMIAFAIARVILIEFDISAHVESMFNILFCYFPITFRPPPNDKYGISSDDLKTNLRRCLSATPVFGTLAIPLFLEKISAGSRATKKDTLQTLAICLPIYGPSVAQSFARKLWNSLKLEIFQPVDHQTETEALKTIQVLVKVIYEDDEVAEGISINDIKGLAIEVSDECIQILKEPEKSQARPATKILCAFMSTTPSIARYTISQVVPHFVQLFRDPDEASTRLGTLTLLCEVIDAARNSVRRIDGDNSIKEPALALFKEDVLGLYITGIQSVHLRTAGLFGLKSLILTDGLLEDEEIGYVVHKVKDLIAINEPSSDETSEANLELLKAIAEQAPSHITDQILPLLIASLPERAPISEAIEREKCWETLLTLRKLSIQPAVFEVMVVHLLAKFDYLCFSSAADDGELQPAQAYSYMILKTLAEAIKTKVNGNHADVTKYIDRLVSGLFNVFVVSAFSSENRDAVALNSRLLLVASDIITLVVQSLSVPRQQAYSSGLWKALLEGDFADISQGFQNLSDFKWMSIFSGPCKRSHRELLILLSSAAIALHKEVQRPWDDTFLNLLVHWVLDTADSDLQRMSALHLLASMVNRHAEDLTSFLHFMLQNYWNSEILDSSRSLQRRQWAIRTWIWTSKALLVRKHPLTVTFAERLFDTLKDKAIGWESAKALGLIVESDAILTKKNHAEVKILYVQKYVSTILPRLVALVRAGGDDIEQTSSLVALISVMKSCPRSAYANDFPSLISFLLRGLDLPDAEVRGSAIAIFIAAAEDETKEKSVISEYGSTLVNLMLKNCREDDMPLVRVRISALQYLELLPSIVRYDVLHPCKPLVLRELGKALDDPKRSVRKIAAQARTTWFKYKG